MFLVAGSSVTTNDATTSADADADADTTAAVIPETKDTSRDNQDDTNNNSNRDESSTSSSSSSSSVNSLLPKLKKKDTLEDATATTADNKKYREEEELYAEQYQQEHTNKDSPQIPTTTTTNATSATATTAAAAAAAAAPPTMTTSSSSNTNSSNKKRKGTLPNQQQQQQQQQQHEHEHEQHDEHEHEHEHEHEQFMQWCQQVLGIQTNLEIYNFEYYDYMKAAMMRSQYHENGMNHNNNDDDWMDDSDDGDGDDDDDDDDVFVDATNNNNNKKKKKKKKKQYPEWKDPPMITVRGLRATRPIEQGEVIISIPFQGLLTVPTTIDQDPVLGRVMGPKARQNYGWTMEQKNNHHNDDNADGNDSADTTTTTTPSTSSFVDYFEMPLLAMALLHHYKLGTSSPLYPYIHLLRQTSTESVPFLWNKTQRQELYHYSQQPQKQQPQQQQPQQQHSSCRDSNSNRGIQSVARGVRLEMKEMYHTVVDPLVRDYPELFGKRMIMQRTGSSSTSSEEQQQQQFDYLLDDMDDDWAFSYENFKWAFAMINTRHWLLPIADLETPSSSSQQQQRQQKLTFPTESPPSASLLMQPQGSVDGVPPAEMPTETWLEFQQEEGDDNDDGNDKREKNDNNYKSNDSNKQETDRRVKEGAATISKSSLYHSFLAPVADLLNFGPPCTRGRYNAELHTFDIVASCNFTTGQEVTFWYSDECEDVVIGNYGFTHPMVPKCPTKDDYRQARDMWKEQALSLEDALEDAYEDLDVLDQSLEQARQILSDCDCCDTTSSYEVQQQRQSTDPSSSESNNVNSLQGRHLRNPSRGGNNGALAGTMMSVGGTTGRSGQSGRRSSGSSTTNTGKRRNRGERASRTDSSDDDINRPGVRRMWAASRSL